MPPSTGPRHRAETVANSQDLTRTKSPSCQRSRRSISSCLHIKVVFKLGQYDVTRGDRPRITKAPTVSRKHTTFGHDKRRKHRRWQVAIYYPDSDATCKRRVDS